jgi:hypothetical protein
MSSVDHISIYKDLVVKFSAPDEYHLHRILGAFEDDVDMPIFNKYRDEIHFSSKCFGEYDDICHFIGFVIYNKVKYFFEVIDEDTAFRAEVIYWKREK